MAIDEGTTLGPYEIRGLLGAGGMGEVYRARDRRLERDVAVKVLSPHLTSRPDILERFEREAKVVASLSHPNIVAIFDVGDEKGHRFVVTELLEGKTLREAISESSRMEWRAAVSLTLPIARGLAAAHGRGITHRDVKPENIFVTAHGPKILDFGLARLDESLQELATAEQTIVKTPAGFVLGTVGYMSPEQAGGEDTGPTSDVFSLGCVLYELLSGVRPFRRKTAAETMHAILREDPKPLPTIDPSVQDDLEKIVLKCLEKEPSRRFPSGAELADSLEALLRGDHESLSRQLPLAVRRGRVGLAILDLESPADDHELVELGTTLTEELQNRLTNETDLNVVARSRIRRLGAAPDPEEAASTLGAGLILAGAVRRSSGAMLLQLELIDVEKGAQLWGGRERLADAGDVSVARAVATTLDALRTYLPFRSLSTMQTNVQPVSQPELSASSLELLGTVRSELARDNESGYRRAVEILEQAVATSPDFALGHAKLADTLLEEALRGLAPTETIREKSIAGAVRAEALYSGPETIVVRARCRAFLEWKWQEAFKSIEGLPASPEAVVARAELLVCTGEKDRAVVQVREALALDRTTPQIGERCARVLYLGRRWIDAQEQAHRTLIQRDSSTAARIVLAMALARQGMFDPAHEELQALVRDIPDQPEADVALAELYALWGKKAGAAKIIRRLDRPPRPRFVPQTLIARIESTLGDADAALRRLETALERSEIHLGFLRVDPAWDTLRGNEAFRRIEARVFADQASAQAP